MDPPPLSLVTALQDRYRLERELGHGGMATVYLGHDLRHDRSVAVKVLRPELSNLLGRERFLREIEIAARLQHPNILALFDSGSACDFLYYVMPYVEGESLRELLDREKQLAFDDVLAIAREVADALAYAHGHGVVHRDIKPGNVLLSGGHALVADFGIARAIREAGGGELTTRGIAVGTPAYIARSSPVGRRTWMDAATSTPWDASSTKCWWASRRSPGAPPRRSPHVTCTSRRRRSGWFDHHCHSRCSRSSRPPSRRSGPIGTRRWDDSSPRWKPPAPGGREKAGGSR